MGWKSDLKITQPEAHEELVQLTEYQFQQLNTRIRNLQEENMTLGSEVEILRENIDTLTKVSSLQAVSGILNGKHLAEDPEVTQLLGSIVKRYLRSLDQSIGMISDSD